MRTKTLDVTFDIKAVEDDGFFSGYGSIFGNVDSYREVVKQGAFTKSLGDWQARSRLPPVLWNHNHNEPIGVYTKMEEDESGLYVEGKLLVSEVQRAREIHALMKAGAIDGMSIGYSVKRSQKADQGVINLLELKLFEVSVVTFPANEESRVDAVKAALDEGELPTLPEFEKFLREAGFSKTQSAAIATGGLSKLLRSESDDDPATKSVSEALAILKAHNGETK